MNKQKNNRTMSVITMGCRVNQFETELLRHGGMERGFSIAKDGESPELLIVNTCSVTSESDRQARQVIRRAARDNPGVKIVVTGCYAQRTPEILSALPQVKLVLGNKEKNDLWSHVDSILQTDNNPPQKMADAPAAEIHVGDISELNRVPDRPVIDSFADRSRAYLQLQDGCDRACTFCLIPGVRGPGRSLQPKQVLDQAKKFIASGFNELVLTGINLGTYGCDLTPSFSLAKILKQLLTVPGCSRIRLSSIDPADIDAELLQIFKHEQKICHYLHLSIQSGDDMILKRMGRKTNRQKIIETIRAARDARPETVFGTDIIVGFPTESEAAFQNSLQLIKEARLVFLHIFRYSDRPGTPAAEIPQKFRVPVAVAKERSEILRLAGEKNLSLVAKQWVGKCEQVLVESITDEGIAQGKIAAFLSVTFKCSGGEKVGELTVVKVTGFDAEKSQLQGEVRG